LHIINTTASISTKFCKVTKTTKLFIGDSNRHMTNPRWRTAAILKHQKPLYLCNGLTDQHEIWYDNEYLVRGLRGVSCVQSYVP